MSRSAQTPPSRALPLGLPVNDALVKPIHRADQSIIGGARGGLYPNDTPGASVEEKLRVRLHDAPIGPATQTSPLGQRR